MKGIKKELNNEEAINDDDSIPWKSEEQLEVLFEYPIHFCRSKIFLIFGKTKIAKNCKYFFLSNANIFLNFFSMID